jgi:hypothetical protein
MRSGWGSEERRQRRKIRELQHYRTPVQPVSALRGEAKARDNVEDFGSGSFVGGDRVT